MSLLVGASLLLEEPVPVVGRERERRVVGLAYGDQRSAQTAVVLSAHAGEVDQSQPLGAHRGLQRDVGDATVAVVERVDHEQPRVEPRRPE